MNFTNVLKKTLISFVLVNTLFLLIPRTISANTIFPHTKEILLSSDERANSIVSFRNDSRKEIFITPVVYVFDPPTLEMSLEDGYIFTRTDKEIFTVQPNETIELNYEIVPISNMRPGTYFNIIILQQERETTFITETNPIGTTNNLAHLVVLHVADPERDIKGVTSEFADVQIEIIEKGIPFLRPTTIRYTYKNKTNYVLNPMGEIQIYSTKGRYPPEYRKVNKEQEKLYPQGTLEEEIEIERYHISDLFTQRMVLGRFYNGIDENLILKEIVIQPNYYIFVGIGIIILSTIALLKVLFSKTRKKKKVTKKKKSKKNPE